MSLKDAKSRSISLQKSLLICILLYMNTDISKASSNGGNTILNGQFLSGNQTISSRNGRFELGFFTPGSSRNYYIGIWYKARPNQTVVWVANREVPVKDPTVSKLMLSETGNLILLTKNSSSSNNIQVWSTNSTTSSSSAAAVLLDTGNIALLINGLDLNSARVWQSFDDPTDTFLPGGWIGLNKITGEYQRLTSWKNSENPSLGLFSMGIDLNGSNQNVMYYNLSKPYWFSGLWNGDYFQNAPTQCAVSECNHTFIDGKDRKYTTYVMTDDSLIARGVMETSGQLVQYVWIESSQHWQQAYVSPLHKCDVFSLCGPFGLCDEKSTNVCQCSFGFQHTNDQDWKLNDWSKECIRKSVLQCADKANDWFYKMGILRLPDNPDQNLSISNRLDCETFCRNDCSCIAYAYDDDKSNSCMFWKGELQNIRQLYDDERGGAALYLRLSAHDMPPPSLIGSKTKDPTNNHYIGIIVGVLLLIVITAILVVIGFARVYRRRRRNRRFRKADGSLIRFHYQELQRMTKNFTEKLGSGGFGIVYRGELPDSTPIAVKSLQGLRQGEKQFRAEVSTLGTIQHVNLVRLRGFCSERTNRKLLVYDFMQKGSLDSHLFQQHHPVLNWSTRYQIALGTAKGLTYLHEQCRERIIHCDIKPDNILLDESFLPKVADFGLAKLYDRDFSKLLTTMRGTIGYLAPEWISGTEVTSKVDVYSYGMMLFEMISGKRNRQIYHIEGKEHYYPLWAAKQIINGNVVGILDARLNGVASIEEVSRLGKVAIWCVQEMEERRPTMSQIVQILEGVLKVNMHPIPQLFQIYCGASEQDTFLSPNLVGEEGKLMTTWWMNL